MTPLNLACCHGQVIVAEALINQKADLLSVGENGQTCLHKAATTGNIELVRLITSAAKEKNQLEQVKKHFHMKSKLLFASI